MGVAAEGLSNADYCAETYYKEAHQCLSTTNNKKLLYKCLESLLLIYETRNDKGNIKDTRKKIAHLDVDELLCEEEDEIEGEKSSQDVFQQVNLADISGVELFCFLLI